MGSEIGFLALLLALAVSLMQILGVLIYPKNINLYSWGKRFTYWQFLLLLISCIGLGSAFYNHDYSISYVAQHSNSLLPWYYRISAIWGGHEGSLLLWVSLLSAWSAYLARSIPKVDKISTLNAAFYSKVLAVLAYIQAGFILFIVATSNPFQKLMPAPFDGQDLNPLLQDFGLIFHPPLLYLGYVGFAIAFAFVIAALWQGDLRREWLRLMRPLTLAAWICLTLGIALGSYWAYYELGWGGWWFWDPVENASLMPWLLGSALVHSLAISEKRGNLLIWSSSLAVLTFSLCLIGTFLVRSGVLTSVHAFASDPTRGIFILLLLLSIMLPSLLLLLARSQYLQGKRFYSLISRDTALNLNNILFSAAALVVFVGTMYPLVLDVFNLGKISVGAPYFNSLIIPLALISLFFLGIAPLLRWQREKKIKRLIFKLFIFSFSLTISAFLIFPNLEAKLLFVFFLAFWALGGIIFDYGKRLFSLKQALPRANLMGMFIAHAGFIVMILAIAANGWYHRDLDISLKVGDKVNIADYQVTLHDLREEKGPNYLATAGKFIIEKKDNPKFLTILEPEKRTYFSSSMPTSESARLITPSHDLYLALGEKINAQTWAVRVQHKPFIIWIWLGGLLMCLGAGIAAADSRYKAREALL